MFPDSSNGPIVGGGGGPVQSPVVAAAEIPAPDADISDSTNDIITDDATTTDTDADVATTTDEVATTTPPVGDTPPPALPTGAPVVDDFDAYNGSGWSVWPTPNNTIILFGTDTGTADPYNTDPTNTNDCHSGNCIISTGAAGGFGSFGYEASMYKESGTPQDQGAFTIWVRERFGWRVPAANIGLCEGNMLGCSNANLLWFTNVAPPDNTWHEYYVAWRQGSSNVETCLMMDDTTASDCSWGDTNIPAGTQFDGVQLQAGVIRPDLGDQVWFDDLAEAPGQ
jgi:hypothetical protein